MKRTSLFIGLIIVAIMTITLASCKSPSEKYINKFERFIEKVEKEGPSYSDEDWSQADSEFKSFITDQFEEVVDDMTDDEKNMVGKLCARYLKARLANNQLYKTLLWLKSYIQTIIGFLEGLGIDVCGFLHSTLGFDVCSLLNISNSVGFDSEVLGGEDFQMRIEDYLMGNASQIQP